MTAACCDVVDLQSEQVVKFETATDVYSVSVADVPLDEVRAAFIVVLAALDVVTLSMLCVRECSRCR